MQSFQMIQFIYCENYSSNLAQVDKGSSFVERPQGRLTLVSKARFSDQLYI